MVTPVRTSSALVAPCGTIQQLSILALSALSSFWVMAVSGFALGVPTVAGLSDGAAGGESLLASSAVILSSKSFFCSIGGDGGRGRMRGSGGATAAVFTGSAGFAGSGGWGASDGVGGVSGVGS